MDSFPLALANLTSIPVLVFVAAVIAARLHTDIRLPDAVYQGITIFLLVGIGIKGVTPSKKRVAQICSCPA